LPETIQFLPLYQSILWEQAIEKIVTSLLTDMEKTEICIFWFRRDLRLDDNAGLFAALSSGYPVLPLFIFDREILDPLDASDRRVEFIHQSLERLQQNLRAAGSDLIVYYGFVQEVMQQLFVQWNIKAVYTNHDYEPGAIARDLQVAELLAGRGIAFHTLKDQVIFEKNEVLKADGKPYTVFTPYSTVWKRKLHDQKLEAFASESLMGGFLRGFEGQLPRLEAMGFRAGGLQFSSTDPDREIIRHYEARRNFPGVAGTTKIGVHLRFGTVSIRKMGQIAMTLSETWLNELIWRDFFMMILWHFPHSANSAFKPAYDRIGWINNEAHFNAWCEGRTGYPIVDAGMRELNSTGFMHNRVRMITASFLTKHLLTDWRWGERYFASQLLDYDLSANAGNWQWAAGSGCDAAPYFRIFNPSEQTKKFDAQLTYIRKWIPELDSFDYPRPIVEHTTARNRALETYKAALT
jgi:deoxyribodipyrimidine photo-lyase